jgi:UDP-N-acetylmuramoylalanine--D-glutamate ligase
MSQLILGLGKTGLSIARYFKRKNQPFRVIDTRLYPSELKAFKDEFPEAPIHLGNINTAWIQESESIIISPGLDPDKLQLQSINPKVKIYSDIDLFNQSANAPIIAITGSNGKSTVSTLVAYLLQAGSQRVLLGGNIGIPALDLLLQPTPDFYVLELSSFQLAVTQKLHTYMSVFLNLSQDHLDRHITLSNYQKIKQKIFHNCQVGIWNRDDMATYPTSKIPYMVDFGTSSICSNHSFSLVGKDDKMWLTQGKNHLLSTTQLIIKGQHNYLNALVALAITRLLEIPLQPILDALKKFTGLPHRLETVAEYNGIQWINDSKATNIHATLAALSTFKGSKEKHLILIVGGIHKSGDLLELKPLVIQHVKHMIVLGRDGAQFKKAFEHYLSISDAKHLKQAVQIASNFATQGDIVLLSPACASQDMFKDYAERGEEFKTQVKLLLSQGKTYDNENSHG